MEEYIQQVADFLGTPLGVYTAAGALALTATFTGISGYFLGRGRKEVAKAYRDRVLAKEETARKTLELEVEEARNAPQLKQLEYDERDKQHDRDLTLKDREHTHFVQRDEQRAVKKAERLEKRLNAKKAAAIKRREHNLNILDELKSMVDDAGVIGAVTHYFRELEDYASTGGVDPERIAYRAELVDRYRDNAIQAGMFAGNFKVDPEEMENLDRIVTERFRDSGKRPPKPPKDVKRFMRAVAHLAKQIKEIEQAEETQE